MQTSPQESANKTNQGHTTEQHKNMENQKKNITTHSGKESEW